jgi:hypothetical protein
MIRVLVMIAVTGFFLSIVTLSTAVAIGGPDVLAAGAWSGVHGHHWMFDMDDDHDRDNGQHATREIAWSGGDSLDVDLPADVTYTQAPGPAKITVSGPKRAVDDVEIADGHIRFDHARHRRHGARLTIVMTAPSVTRFEMSGSGELAIENYRQEKLSLDLSGDSEVSVKGEATALALDISGSGDADLSGLQLKGASVDISGSGEATLAPTDWAKLGISGSGDVTLLSHPARLESDISGSGSIHQSEAATPSPPPSPSAAPSPSPRPGRT